ncbi:MAG: zinc ribbon domain-containing protein [Desulfobacteraceae bacterium]|nr:zinc ribbon domain-containing protein [Desulfobacteraceae bacterium]MBC2754147.1 zinc ribbon domain-containing protein [Desulfobacteraceae bacterium]
MPIYEYECAKCGHIHEIMQKMSDKPLSKCPNCTGKLHKLISQSSFHLKGSGWYVTDYANKSNSSPASVKNKETKKAEKKSSEKTTTSKKESSD